MQTATSLKAGAAFLAGVAIALGGAFTYFKATESHYKPAAQMTTIIDGVPAGPDLSAEVSKLQTVVVSDAAVPHPIEITPVSVRLVTPKAVLRPKLVLATPRVTSRPVSLAVSNLKSNQMPEPVAQPLTPVSEISAPAEQSGPPTPQPIIAPPPQPRQAHTVTIPAGTNLAVRMNEKLSTEHNFNGDTFRATLDTPIVMDGFIIADRGAKVLGRIVKAQRPGKLEGMAELSLTLTEIATTDGQRLRVETNESLRKGSSNTNEEVLKMGGGAVLGAIIGAIAGGGKGAAIGAGAGGAAGTGAVLLGHGKPAVIDDETRLTFALAGPATITEQLN